MASLSSRTIQTWPDGYSYTYRGDEHGPLEQFEICRNGLWRIATADEQRTIRVALRAEMYAANYIKGCDSSLVDALIEAANSGEISSDLANAFSVDELRNLYADPSDWDAAQCRAYADEHDVELPDLEPCAEHDAYEADCEGCAEMCEDDSPRGWLTEAREACRDFAQDNPAEVFEWWRVDSWLCGQLDAIGEVTIDNGFGTWWGRCATGQALIMDGVLQRIAASFEREVA